MTRNGHDRTRLLVRWGIGLAGIVILALVVGQLEASRPSASPDRRLEVGPSSEDDPDPLTCVRRVPTPEDADGDAPSSDAPAGRITSAELIECPDRFDGRTVVYVGEVIGDVLQRDGGAWVLMNDDAYALETGPLPASGELHGYNSGLSVWLDGGLHELVDQPGGPEWRGDVLRVRGTVHRADPDDGGGLTIRATEAEVVAEAVPIEDPLHRPQAIVAGVLAAIAFGVVVWERRVARTH